MPPVNLQHAIDISDMLAAMTLALLSYMPISTRKRLPWGKHSVIKGIFVSFHARNNKPALLVAERSFFVP